MVLVLDLTNHIYISPWIGLAGHIRTSFEARTVYVMINYCLYRNMERLNAYIALRLYN